MQQTRLDRSSQIPGSCLSAKRLWDTGQLWRSVSQWVMHAMTVSTFHTCSLWLKCERSVSKHLDMWHLERSFLASIAATIRLCRSFGSTFFWILQRASANASKSPFDTTSGQKQQEPGFVCYLLDIRRSPCVRACPKNHLYLYNYVHNNQFLFVVCDPVGLPHLCMPSHQCEVWPWNEGWRNFLKYLKSIRINIFQFTAH